MSSAADRCIRAADQDLARAGLRNAAVELVDYDPAWQSSFEAERKRLGPLLRGIELHHFGSCAPAGRPRPCEADHGHPAAHQAHRHVHPGTIALSW